MDRSAVGLRLVLLKDRRFVLDFLVSANLNLNLNLNLKLKLDLKVQINDDNNINNTTTEATTMDCKHSHVLRVASTSIQTRFELDSPQSPTRISAQFSSSSLIGCNPSGPTTVVAFLEQFCHVFTAPVDKRVKRDVLVAGLTK